MGRNQHFSETERDLVSVSTDQTAKQKKQKQQTLCCDERRVADVFVTPITTAFSF